MVSILVVFSAGAAALFAGDAGAAAPAVTPPAPLAAPDEAAAVKLAYRKRFPVLVTGLTTETSQTWAQPDGSFKMSLSMSPERMRDGSGAWTPVDLTMERKADGSVGPKAHPRGLRLSGPRSSGGESFVDLGSGADLVSLGWRGVLPAPDLSGARATYPDVKPGIDLVVQARPAGFEYFVVVKNEDAAASVATVSLPWSAGPLARGEGAGLQAKLAGGLTVSLPPAQMWDARVSPSSDEPLHQAEVSVATTTDATGKTDLVLTPDPAFFEDAGLTFPVTIDPAVDLNPAYDAFIQNTYSSDQSGSTQLKVGYSDDSSDSCASGCVARSLLRFQQPSALENADVLSAELFLYNYHSWSCTAMQWEAWRVSQADTSYTWAHQPTWVGRTSLTNTTKGGGSGCAAGWVSIPVSGIFRYVADTPSETMAKIGLLAPSETNHNSWKKFYSSEAASLRPYVELSYNHKPNVPTTLAIDSCYSACASPAVVSSGTPTLKATFSDPDGGTMRAEFEVYNPAHDVSWGRSLTSVTGVASGTARAWKIVPPAGYSRLPDNPYVWRVRACETYNGAALCGDWSGFFNFTVSTAMPTLPTVSSTAYPPRSSGSYSGGKGVAGSFSFGPNQASGVTEYIYSLNDGNPVNSPAGTPGSQILTANQQNVSTDITGFVPGVSSVISRSAAIGHNAPGSVQVTPSTTAGSDAGNQGDTYAGVGGDHLSGLRLGMVGGHRYWVTGWIYVPSATGLGSTGSYGEPRGMRIAGYARAGSNPYIEYKSQKATATDQWQQLSMVIAVPTGATEAFIRLYNGYPVGQTTKVVYWDDLSMTEVTGTTGAAAVAPTRTGLNKLAVQSRTASGLTSDQSIYEFYVSSPAGTNPYYWPMNSRTDPSPSEPVNDRPLTRSASGVTWSSEADSAVGASAAVLDGTGDLTTATAVLDTANPAGFSVAVWAQPAAVTGNRVVVSQQGTNTSLFRLELRDDLVDGNGDGTTDPAWCFTMRSADTTSSATAAACTTDYVVPDVWTHLAGVFNPATNEVKLYVGGGYILGGSEAQATYGPSTAWSASGKFTVGRGWNATAVDRWTGSIDAVRAIQDSAVDTDVAVWADPNVGE